LYRARRIFLLYTSRNDHRQHYLREFKEGNNSEKNLTQKFLECDFGATLDSVKAL